jgi:glutamine amidotransferase
MQVLLDFSEEDGGTEMLGLIPGRVVRFQPVNQWDKVPQIGWNSIHLVSQNSEQKNRVFSSPLFTDIEDGSDFYFIHSFYPKPANDRHVLAQTSYAGTTFSSVLQHENIIATQFHPEKSGKIGLQLLANFVKKAK